MSNTFKFKRGLETNRSGQTPAAGEPLWTTDGNRLFIGDGATAGGVEIAYARTGENETITGSWTFDSAIAVDTINEYTGAAGVTIDGVLLKDGEVTVDANINFDISATRYGRIDVDTTDLALQYYNAGVLDTNIVLDAAAIHFNPDNTSTASLTTSGLAIDQISEKTAAAGVIVDGVHMKDSGITVGANIKPNANNSYSVGESSLRFTNAYFQNLDLTGTVTGLSIGSGQHIDQWPAATRDKYRVWNDAAFAIGMDSGYTFGAINNDFAMTFQMNNASNRGFWWGDEGHTDAQGAMALSTDGKLSVAHSVRIGYGESDTVVPGGTAELEVSGGALISDLAGTGVRPVEVTADGTLQAGTSGGGFDPDGAASITTSTTLTTSSAYLQKATPADYGMTITLPDATTYSSVGGVKFEIHNNGGFDVIIEDDGGTVVGFLPPNKHTTVGLVDKSTAAGDWVFSDVTLVGKILSTSLSLGTVSFYSTGVESVEYDTGKYLFLLGASNLRVYAVVYDSTTRTLGLPVLIRTSVDNEQFKAVKISTTQVLAMYSTNNNFYARVLGISGTTITANTEASNNTSDAYERITHAFESGTSGSYVAVTTGTTDEPYVIAATISGTTVTLGSPLAANNGSYTTYSQVAYGMNEAYPVGSGLVVISCSGGTTNLMYAEYISISGTTCTSSSTATSGSADGDYYRTVDLSSTKWASIYAYSTGVRATVFSYSAGTMSAATYVTTGLSNQTHLEIFKISSTKAFIGNRETEYNILTENAGSVSVGTELSLAYAPTSAADTRVRWLDQSENTAVVTSRDNSDDITHLFLVDVSGSSATFERMHQLGEGDTGGRVHAPYWLKGSTYHANAGAVHRGIVKNGCIDLNKEASNGYFDLTLEDGKFGCAFGMAAETGQDHHYLILHEAAQV